MINLPEYIRVVFVLTTLLTVLLFFRAAKGSRTVLIILFAWLVLQAVISRTGFYTDTHATPPHFAWLVLPPLLIIILLFLTRSGKKLMDGLDAKTLTLLQTVRIFVELVLYWLMLNKVVPKVMTFEGRNFDILAGLTAPLIFYFGFIKRTLGKKVLIAWNGICILLLVNIVITAVLSAPFPFQQFGFEQPNIAILYFPFVWLPCCIVPLVLLSHLATIRQLLK